MQYIGKAHIQTIQAVNLMMKFKEREARFAEQLTANYIKKSDDLETALAYGFYKFLGITSLVQGDDLVNTDLLKVIEVYDHALTKTPDDWFLHMAKLLVYSKLPEKMACDADKLQTLNWMLQAQMSAPTKEPYFILPYIIYAEHWYSHDDYNLSSRFLVDGANNTPAKGIDFPDLNPHLAFPVKDFYMRLYYSHHSDLARQLKELGKIFFVKEPIFH